MKRNNLTLWCMAWILCQGQLTNLVRCLIPITYQWKKVIFFAELAYYRNRDLCYYLVKLHRTISLGRWSRCAFAFPCHQKSLWSWLTPIKQLIRVCFILTWESLRPFLKNWFTGAYEIKGVRCSWICERQTFRLTSNCIILSTRWQCRHSLLWASVAEDVPI